MFQGNLIRGTVWKILGKDPGGFDKGNHSKSTLEDPRKIPEELNQRNHL